MKIKIVYIFVFIIFSVSCTSKKNWNNANIIYKNNDEKNMFVAPAERSYYNFIKAKPTLKTKKEYLYPDIVQKIENEDFKYISIFFPEEDFGIESYGFGEVITGDEVLIVKTKFREKTCACKTSGTYFKGFFLVHENEILRIRTNKKNVIINIRDVYDFFDKYSETGLIKNINTIDDIINYLKNINN